MRMSSGTPCSPTSWRDLLSASRKQPLLLCQGMSAKHTWILTSNKAVSPLTGTASEALGVPTFLSCFPLQPRRGCPVTSDDSTRCQHGALDALVGAGVLFPVCQVHVVMQIRAHLHAQCMSVGVSVRLCRLHFSGELAALPSRKRPTMEPREFINSNLLHRVLPRNVTKCCGTLEVCSPA